jgi:hypothetical protein
VAASNRAGDANVDANVLFTTGRAETGMDSFLEWGSVCIATARPPEAHPFYAAAYSTTRQRARESGQPLHLLGGVWHLQAASIRDEAEGVFR